MNCQQARELLPLGVEGDLARACGEALAAHLQACEACWKRAQALQASQAWLKGAPPMPFTVEERAELRRTVMVQVRERTAPRRLRARWLLGVAAVGLGLLVPVRFHRHVAVPLTRPAPVAVAQVAAQPSLPLPLPLPRPLPLTGRVRQQHPQVRPAPVEAAPVLARIEFTTGNPGIRIIWLARTSDAPGGSPNALTEAP